MATSGFLKLSESQAAQLEAHWQLLNRWNQRLNLTRIDSLDEAIERHYGEALFLASLLPPESLAIADIGSGAGFPGFPIAIARSDCQVTLIESHQRKSVFLKEVSRGIPNLRVLAKRAEDVREDFDCALVRAVAWADIREAALRMAPTAFVLAGSGEVESREGQNKVVRKVSLPWGRSRFVVEVSRETSCSH